MMMRLASIRLGEDVRKSSEEGPVGSPQKWRLGRGKKAEAYIQRLGYRVSHEESFDVSIGGSSATRTALVMHVLIHESVYARHSSW